MTDDPSSSDVSPDSTERRTLLAVLSSFATTAIAGCSGGSNDTPEATTPTATERSTPVTTEQSTPTETQTPTPTETATPEETPTEAIAGDFDGLLFVEETDRARPL